MSSTPPCTDTGSACSESAAGHAFRRVLTIASQQVRVRVSVVHTDPPLREILLLDRAETPEDLAVADEALKLIRQAALGHLSTKP